MVAEIVGMDDLVDEPWWRYIMHAVLSILLYRSICIPYVGLMYYMYLYIVFLSFFLLKKKRKHKQNNIIYCSLRSMLIMLLPGSSPLLL